MSDTLSRLLLPALLAAALPLTGRAQRNALVAGGRYRTDHSEFDKMPYGNGDISYLLGWAHREGIAVWQLAVDFGPDVSGTMNKGEEDERRSFDYVITPQLNMLINDERYYMRGGLGICTSYIKSPDHNEWLDPYWQFLLGLHLPVTGRIALDATAVYTFDRWRYLDKFSFGDLEYVLALNFAF